MRDERWSIRQLNDFHGYLYTVNNGKMDVEGFLDSEYGKEMADRLMIRSAIENDRKAAIAYYDSIGLEKTWHDDTGFYDRWTLLVPKQRAPGQKFALVFWLHGAGNSIEAEENMTGFPQLAAREGFILACPQNTNPDKVLEIYHAVDATGILDRSRVYLAGFSQGGSQTHASYFRHPELFAAAVTSGNDPWQPWDCHNIPYTAEEIAKTSELRVPLYQMCGMCEPFPYAPLNEHVRRNYLTGKPWGRPDTFVYEGADYEMDPTRILEPGAGRLDPIFGDGKKVHWRMANHYDPQPGEDPGRWKIGCVNMRLSFLACPPLDVEHCMSFCDLHQNDLHRITGIYGDHESIDYYYGYRHYTVGICDRNGDEMYRYTTVQNSPHWPQLAIGELGWQFMKQFSREPETGRLIVNHSK